MAQLDKTFPTVDCSHLRARPQDGGCFPARKKSSSWPTRKSKKFPATWGNFTVKVRKKASYVNFDLCTGCGLCTEKCPSRKSPDEFNEGLAPTTAINIPFPQAIPKKAVINPETCIKIQKDKCGVCAKVCPADAIDYTMQDEIVEVKTGAIVAATGFGLFNPDICEEYGGGTLPGRCHLHSIRTHAFGFRSYGRPCFAVLPTDRKPKNVVFIQCVGSRDPSLGRPLLLGILLHVHGKAGHPDQGSRA